MAHAQTPRAVTRPLFRLCVFCWFCRFLVCGGESARRRPQTRATLQLAAAVPREMRRGPVDEECPTALRATGFDDRVDQRRAMSAMGADAVGLAPPGCGSGHIAGPLDDRPPIGADADEFQVLPENRRRLVVDVQDDLAARLPNHPIPRAAPQPKVEVGLHTRPRQFRHYGISVRAWYFTGRGTAQRSIRSFDTIRWEVGIASNVTVRHTTTPRGVTPGRRLLVMRVLVVLLVMRVLSTSLPCRRRHRASAAPSPSPSSPPRRIRS